MKALLLIDIQNDFLEGGALEVPEGNAVLPIANQLLQKFDYRFATQDWHPHNHGSFASQHPEQNLFDVIDFNGLSQVLWPDHCVQGTMGANFHDNLQSELIDEIVQKGMDITVDSYSGFYDNGGQNPSGLHERFQRKGIDTLYVCGLATDYCVKFTVLDALKLGYSVFLVVDGCRGVNQQLNDSADAIQEMENAGAQLIASVDVPDFRIDT